MMIAASDTLDPMSYHIYCSSVARHDAKVASHGVTVHEKLNLANRGNNSGTENHYLDSFPHQVGFLETLKRKYPLQDDNKKIISGADNTQWNLLFSSSSVQSESYIRNNRSNGCKNLRCFPTCRKEGHVQSGFCGDEYAVVIRGANNQGFQNNGFHTYAYFESQETFGKRQVGSVITQASLSDLEASKLLYRGSIMCGTDDECVTICMSFFPQSWTYNYKSNRFARGQHGLRIMMTMPVGNDQEKSKKTLLRLISCIYSLIIDLL